MASTRPSDSGAGADAQMAWLWSQSGGSLSLLRPFTGPWKQTTGTSLSMSALRPGAMVPPADLHKLPADGD
eukprot:1567461-Prymnesium_polylepis.1